MTTPPSPPELPALTDEELDGYDDSALLIAAKHGDKRPIEIEAVNLRRFVSAARRCLSAERELASLRAAVDKHFPDDGFLPEVTREETLAGCRAALDMFREMALTELPKLFGTELEKAERSLSEVKAEWDELKAKVAKLECHLSECRFKLSEYGV